MMHVVRVAFEVASDALRAKRRIVIAEAPAGFLFGLISVECVSKKNSCTAAN